MNALDSPLEALPLNYLSFGFLTAVNNVWAWVAVITAAVSVWRIRASSPRGGKSLDESSLLTCHSSPAPPSSSSSSSSSVAERVAAKPAEAAVSSTPSTSAPISMIQGEGRTSGKFIVYYREEEVVEDCANDDGNDEVDALGCDNGEMEKFLGASWGVLMKMRMGDMGWYRYQDLTVLDGNVVRLWDNCRRRNAAPITSCGRCISTTI